MPRPNYHQARKQKELSRKARQLEKQQRRTTRPNESGETAVPLQDPTVGPSDPTTPQQRDMRLARATPRQDRSAQLRRDQEAAPKLRAMFPGVEQLRFELSFESVGTTTPVPQSHVLHPPARAFFSFRCPHADCDGRFELATAVHAAVEDPSHRIEGVLDWHRIACE